MSSYPNTESGKTDRKRARRASTQKLQVLFPAQQKSERVQEGAITWRDLISHPLETWLSQLPLSSCKGRKKLKLSNKRQRCKNNKSHWQAGKHSSKQFDWFQQNNSSFEWLGIFLTGTSDWSKLHLSALTRFSMSPTCNRGSDYECMELNVDL